MPAYRCHCFSSFPEHAPSTIQVFMGIMGLDEGKVISMMQPNNQQHGNRSSGALKDALVPVHTNNSLLVFFGSPLVGGTRLIAAIVGAVILVGPWHKDYAQHCFVGSFLYWTMCIVSTEVW